MHRSPSVPTSGTLSTPLSSSENSFPIDHVLVPRPFLGSHYMIIVRQEAQPSPPSAEFQLDFRSTHRQTTISKLGVREKPHFSAHLCIPHAPLLELRPTHLQSGSDGLTLPGPAPLLDGSSRVGYGLVWRSRNRWPSAPRSRLFSIPRTRANPEWHRIRYVLTYYDTSENTATSTASILNLDPHDEQSATTTLEIEDSRFHRSYAVRFHCPDFSRWSPPVVA